VLRTDELSSIWVRDVVNPELNPGLVEVASSTPKVEKAPSGRGSRGNTEEKGKVADVRVRVP
jgi:hypothetical protein